MIRNALLYRAAPVAALYLLVAAGAAAAQQPTAPDCAAIHAVADHRNMDHAAHLAAQRACEPGTPGAPGGLPTQAGQAAFGAIAEVVRLLEADSTTDWSKVNIEALRQHLIDMDNMTLHAAVAQRNVAGGIEADVTGQGPTLGAIQRMVPNHVRMLDASARFAARADLTPLGVHLVVTAKDPADARAVAMIRGLGVAGLMTEGEHHAAHHWAIARGDAAPHGH